MGALLDAPLRGPLGPGALGAAVAFGIAGLAWAPLAPWRPCRRGCRATVLLIALAAGGFVAGCAATRPSALIRLSESARGLEGPWRARARVLREPEAVDDGSFLDARVDAVLVDRIWEACDDDVRIWLPQPPPADLAPGDRFEAILSMSLRRRPANPGSGESAALTTPWRRPSAYLKSYVQLRRESPSSPWPIAHIRQLPARLRGRVRQAIDRHFADHGALVRALVLGERGGLDPDLTADLARSGLAHLLAISGLHVGIVASLVLMAFRGLGGSRPAAAAAAIGAVVLLAGIAVPRASIRRATWMATAVLAGITLGRRHRALDALALAGMALGLADPLVVRDPGFQLSFAATVGILAWSPGLKAAVARLRIPGATYPAGTLAAQLAVAPLIAVAARRIAVAGFFLNLVAVPLAVPLMATVLGGVAAGVAGLDSVAGPLAAAAGVLADALHTLARWGASLAWTSLPTPGATALGGAVFAAGITVGLRGPAVVRPAG